MKYRILHYTTRKGVHIYKPQYKKFIFWNSFRYSPCMYCEIDEVFNTFEEAKKFIDDRRVDKNKERENEVVAIETINLGYD